MLKKLPCFMEGVWSPATSKDNDLDGEHFKIVVSPNVRSERLLCLFSKILRIIKTEDEGLLILICHYL